MNHSDKPRLYSKKSLMLFSIIGCFFAGLLYIQNLREVGKNKFILLMLAYSILFPTVSSKILTVFGIPMSYSYLPINLLGGYFLITTFWNYQLDIDIPEYESKSILIPGLILLGLIVILVLLTILGK